MRLIDADALGIGPCKPEVFGKPGYADGWNAAIRILRNAPTIDPVKHGRWETVCNEDTAYIKLYRCSCCKDDFLLDEGEIEENGEYNYCPNCGARMDLEVRK